MAESLLSKVQALGQFIVGVRHGNTTQELRNLIASVAFIDGSNPFTSAVAGITPTAAAHLATKGYVDAWPKLGSVNLSASATTSLTAMAWSEIAGTFEIGSPGSSEWTLAPSGAGLVWGGSESVWVDVVAQCAFADAGNGNAVALGVAVEGTVQGDHGHTLTTSLGDTPGMVTQVVLVAPGETVSLQIQNHTSDDDADIIHLTCTMRAHPVQS